MFGDQAMTLEAIDRLVHHATILEMKVESYRRRAAPKTVFPHGLQDLCTVGPSVRSG